MSGIIEFNEIQPEQTLKKTNNTYLGRFFLFSALFVVLSLLLLYYIN